MKLKLRNVFKVDVFCLFVRTFLSEKCVFLFSHRADFIKSEETQMKKIAVIGAVLEEPNKVQQEFNDVVASFKGIVRGRMGIPFERDGIAVISLTVTGDLDQINNLTGRLGKIEHVSVKAAISKRDISED